MNNLSGRIAVVTGGGGGLGRAICASLAEAGAVVVPADVRSEAACEVAREIAAAGGCAEPVCFDVCDAEAAAGAVDAIARRFGSLDALVNCAGIDVTVPVEQLSVAEWDRILGVNLRAPFVLAREAFVFMKRQGSGHVVNIVSTAAKRAWGNATAYHASKWGLLGLSHALHVEGRPHGVKVTAVIAGGMRTPFILERFPETDPDLLQDARNVADTVRFVVCQPAETVIPEVTVIPMRETSWP